MNLVATLAAGSIKDIGSFLFPVWGKTASQIHGRKYTLDEIENDRLQALGGRPHDRLRVALVPVARARAHHAGLDSQLDAAFARFVADPAPRLRSRASRRERVLRLSASSSGSPRTSTSTGGAGDVSQYASARTATC
jgi:hypothetical protein